MPTMTHDAALGSQATDRYLFADMTDDERDAFEEHYFDCFLCADDLKAALMVRDALPKVVETNVLPFTVRVRQQAAALATAATLAMAGLLGWDQLVRVPAMQASLAQAREAGVPQWHIFDERRGESAAIYDSRRTSEALVRIDGGDKAETYRWTVVDAQGRPKLDGTANADLVKDLMLPIVIPAGSLEPGKYTLRVLSKRAARYEFMVR